MIVHSATPERVASSPRRDHTEPHSLASFAPTTHPSSLAGDGVLHTRFLHSLRLTHFDRLLNSERALQPLLERVVYLNLLLSIASSPESLPSESAVQTFKTRMEDVDQQLKHVGCERMRVEGAARDVEAAIHRLGERLKKEEEQNEKLSWYTVVGSDEDPWHNSAPKHLTTATALRQNEVAKQGLHRLEEKLQSTSGDLWSARAELSEDWRLLNVIRAEGQAACKGVERKLKQMQGLASEAEKNVFEEIVQLVVLSKQ